MTSGTSLQDLVHQALDQAAYVTGWSSADQKDGEHQQPAPGNHPDDPDATVNQPSSKDTEPKANGEARPEAEGQGPEDGTSRALGNEGPIGKALGSNLTEGIKRQLEGKEDNHPGERDEEAAADGVGANTDQVQSKEPEADAAKNQPEKGEADMAAQDHDGERGAIWASRPNEEQAQKVKEQKQKGQAGSAPPSKGSGAATLGADNQKSRPRVSDAPSANGSSRSGLTSLLGGGQAQKLPMSPQSSARRSRWTENNRGLRSAFDSAEDGSEGEPSAIKSNDSATPGQASAGPGTPSTPAAGKMRAISNILIGSQRGQPGGDTTPPDGQTSKGGQAEEGAPAEGDDTVAGRTGAPGQTAGAAKWSALKNKLRNNNAKAKADTAKTRASQTDLTRELQSGILPVLLLKMSLERDEQKHRRIPVLLNHIRLRITDSVNPLHNTHAVFRIELEYGDGLVKWVVYRELRDFINLHTHYRVAALQGYLGRASGNTEGDLGLPSFPKTSLPYFNQIQRQNRGKGAENFRAEFAKAQRDALENYIIELIRRTMFRPEANRLCKFFEISALSVSLASRGGYQGKQGYLRIMSKSSRKNNQKGILTPVSWHKSHEPKWFIVRESFIVTVDEPDTLQIHDVFLMDNEFAIERPKRLYKQTIHLAQGLSLHDKQASEKQSGDSEDTEGAGGSTWAAKGHHRNASAPADNTAMLTDGQFRDPAEDDDGLNKKGSAHRDVSSHTFYIKNAERKLKLVAKNERQMEQFIASMERVAARNIWSGSNRFGSFAPMRLNCSAQWLVDGRDYFWNVSKALLMAKDRIFIHDWWLSPELYLRRPGTPKYRLDNILKQKASEGVRIFVIIYNEVSNNFTPTDSNYTKQRLIGLHPNIYVQRSPSHFQTGTFYWAHHEKLCVIDETIAFMGGLDLCFGRWDTPGHVLVDDAEFDREEGNMARNHVSEDPALLGPARDGREAHVWPGQDYANERVMEWHTLSKPEQDLFPRDKFPRMPWHDTGLQLVGQPARDLCRHFVQRWNFLLRIKNHSRVMPFLVPPPDFSPAELTKFGLTGTCEAQICRSAGPWSLGTSSTVEHSVQNAYLKAIQMSEHFVYIENQFFITSTVVEGNTVENKIGEALVDRIIRAHRDGTPWRAIIVIPLIPGFPMPIDHPDASSVRLIVECQNRSICRGEHSIFAKLRREGIDPDEYINFFSLRTWGKLRGGQLTTEQVYIHGKVMVVDDRLALIGSANINERSQRGDRDSELACVIRDTDMIDSTMGGQPFKVGRFAHTLRVRLMREHLGVDVDEMEAEEVNMDMMDQQPSEMQDEEDGWDPDHEQERDTEAEGTTHVHPRHTRGQYRRMAADLATDISSGVGVDVRNMMADHHRVEDVAEKLKGDNDYAGDTPKKEDDLSEKTRTERVRQIAAGKNKGQTEVGFDSSVVPTLEEKVVAEDRPVKPAPERSAKERKEMMDKKVYPRPGPVHATSSHDVADGSGLANGKPQDREGGPEDPKTTQEGAYDAEKKAKQDPSTTAAQGDRAKQDGRQQKESQRYANNSESIHRVSSGVTFESQGSESGRTEATKTEVTEEELRRKMSNKMSSNPWAPPTGAPGIDPHNFADPLTDQFFKDMWMASAVHNTQIFRKVFKSVPDDTVTTWSEYKAFMAWYDRLSRSGSGGSSGKAGGKDGPTTEKVLDTSPRAGEEELSSAGTEAGEDTHHPSNGPANGAGVLSAKDALRDDAGPGRGSQGRAAGAGTNTSRSGAPTRDYPTHIPKAPSFDDGFTPKELEQMEALLEETRGHLVLHPTRFLEAEDLSNNFLFAMDRINPLNVYD